jgi:ABC-type transporter Mla maintaining outer membrane lipid asymmetry ATPase subunit MlaF
VFAHSLAPTETAPPRQDSTRPRSSVVIENLRVQRGDRVVLDDLSLRITEGSVTGLLGPSAAGSPR